MLSVLAIRGYRKLWLSQVVSELGDWLNRMAVLALIDSMVGEKEAVAALGLMFAIELATRLAPTALISPLAGPIADRFSRRAVMIWADLARAVAVIGLCFVDRPEELPWLYGLVLVQMAISPFFESARSASIPNLVPSDQLADAHALGAATWSTMLALGSAAGGLVVTLVGTVGTFALDAGTYLVSAALLWGLRLPPPPSHPNRLAIGDVFFARDLRRAWAHVRDLGLGSVIAAKVCWGMGGGFLVLLSVIGSRSYEGVSAVWAISMLYAARGVGTGVGPVIARRLVGDGERAAARTIAIAFLIAAGGYSFVFLVPHFVGPNLFLACLGVGVAHVGGSTIWVFSTVLWQKQVDDSFRGRVHSLDFLAMTSAFAVWGFATGLLYDWSGSLGWALALPIVSAALAGPFWWWLGGRYIGQGGEGKA